MFTVHRQVFSELKMPYDTVMVADFANLECEASAKSVTGTRGAFPRIKRLNLLTNDGLINSAFLSVYIF